MTNGVPDGTINVLKGIHSLLRIFTTYIRIFHSNPEVMPPIPRLFAIAILKPIIGGTSPVPSNAQVTPNNGPIYVIQLSLFTCLFIISLLLILITLFLSFILFLYTHQSTSRQELLWDMPCRKWLEMILRPPIKRSRHYRKRQTIHHRYRSRHCCDQLF